MPKPLKGEKQKDYISRCIPIVIKEGTAKDQKQAAAICYSMWRDKDKKKAEGDDMILLESGPTILGAAVTNRPFIKGLPPISFKEDGTMVVPLLKKGTYRHKSGKLVFDENVFQHMIENFDNNVLGIDISLDNRHKPELGANGWFKRVYVNPDGLLCAEVDPTPPGKEAIENKQYRYASIEFHRDWTSPEERFSTDDLVEISETEGEMPETITLEQYQEAEQARLELEQRLNETNERLVALQESHLDAVGQLQAQLLREKVSSVIASAEAYRSEGGMGHPKILVDWARNAMLLQDIGEGDGVVTLEDASESSDVLAYFRKAIKFLLESLPGTVPFETNTPTEGNRDRDLDANVELSEEVMIKAAKEFWGVAVEEGSDAN